VHDPDLGPDAGEFGSADERIALPTRPGNRVKSDEAKPKRFGLRV
jgi:hypothetical protein